MDHPQTAIIPDHCKAGIFIGAGIFANRQNDIKTACRESLKVLGALQDKCPEDSLGVTVASGSDVWTTFSRSGEGSKIKPFRPLSGGLIPATRHDTHVRTQSVYQNTAPTLSQSVLVAFGDNIRIVGKVHGFCLL